MFGTEQMNGKNMTTEQKATAIERIRGYAKQIGVGQHTGGFIIAEDKGGTFWLLPPVVADVLGSSLDWGIVSRNLDGDEPKMMIPAEICDAAAAVAKHAVTPQLVCRDVLGAYQILPGFMGPHAKKIHWETVAMVDIDGQIRPVE